MIYLDANASSRLRPRAVEVLSSFAADNLKNSSSVHAPGRKARGALNDARQSILKLLSLGNPLPSATLVFTSGGTEANNALVSGFLGNPLAGHGRILTTAIEHPSMLEPLKRYKEHNWDVIEISPDADGRAQSLSFLEALSPDTQLVSIMAANNETGAIQPVCEISRALRERGYSGPIICDFTQAFGKTLISAAELFNSGVDAISVSGHKLGAPAGIGAFVLNTSSDCCRLFEPLLVGGPQEKRYRAGTENVLGAVAFGAVCAALANDLPNELQSRKRLRDLLWQLIEEGAPDAQCLTPGGSETESISLANTLLVRFPGIRGDDLVVGLDLQGICASTGSACSSGRQDVSYVAQAMGLSRDEARDIVRFSLDWDSTEEMMYEAARVVVGLLQTMRISSMIAQEAA